jgi:hypothetical protein
MCFFTIYNKKPALRSGWIIRLPLIADHRFLWYNLMIYHVVNEKFMTSRSNLK